MNDLIAVREILQTARDLIAPRGHWCQGALAMNRRGDEVLPHDITAVKWCALGAILKQRPAAAIREALFAALNRACEELYWMTAVAANDKLGKAKVLAAFDLAIKESEATP